MSFNCPDCEEPLESTVREIELELEDGETAQFTESGVLIATKVACSNGCSDKPQKRKTKKEKKAPSSAADTEACDHEGCIRPAGHAGSHYRKVEK